MSGNDSGAPNVDAWPVRAKPRTATDRSRARYRRAARVLSPITLDVAHARKLDAILAGTGESAAAWVRRKIQEDDTPSRAPR